MGIITGSSVSSWRRCSFNSRLIFIALLACFIGNEMFFGASLPTLWRGSFTGIMVLILVLQAMHAYRFLPKDITWKILGFGLAILILIGIERVIPSPFDSTLPWWFFPQFVGIWAACLLGLFLGRDAVLWNDFTVVLAWICAMFGVWLALMPLIDSAEAPPFPILSLSYRASAVVAFGYCYFLTMFLHKKKRNVFIFVGLIATGMGVFGHMTKSMVFLGFVSTLSAIVVVYQIQRSKRVLYRALNLIMVFVIIILGINQAKGGSLIDSIGFNIKTKFFHLNEDSERVFPERELFIQKLSAGRLDIWAETWDRFKTSPFFGSGFGQTSDLQLSISGSEVPWHNTWLEIPIALGVLGTISILVAMLWLIPRILLSPKNGKYPIYFAPCFAYIIGVAAIHAASSGMVFLTMNILAGLSVGSLIMHRFLGNLQKPQSESSPKALK